MGNYNSTACRKSNVFKSARCCFPCHDQTNTIDMCECFYDQKKYNTTYPDKYLLIDDITDNFKPLESTKPNLFRKCLKKE